MNNLIHIWSVLCGNSSVDQNTNNISLFNVLEQVNVEKKILELAKASDKNIVAAINFQLVTFWKKEVQSKSAKFEQKIVVIDSKGKILGEASKILEITNTQSRVRVINSFNGLPITSPGEYQFKVLLKNNENNKFIEQTNIPLMVKEDLK